MPQYDRVINVITPNAAGLAAPFDVSGVSGAISLIGEGSLQAGEVTSVTLAADGKAITGTPTITGTLPAGSVVAIGGQDYAIIADVAFGAAYPAGKVFTNLSIPNTSIWNRIAVQTSSEAEAQRFAALLKAFPGSLAFSLDGTTITPVYTGDGSIGARVGETVHTPETEDVVGYTLPGVPFSGLGIGALQLWDVTINLPALTAIMTAGRAIDPALGAGDLAKILLAPGIGAAGGEQMWSRLIDYAIADRLTGEGDDATVTTSATATFEVQSYDNLITSRVVDDEGTSWDVIGIERTGIAGIVRLDCVRDI